jgi:hypothetical protein
MDTLSTKSMSTGLKVSLVLTGILIGLTIAIVSSLNIGAGGY